MSDGPKVYRDNLVRARKQYACCECDGTISKGEFYNNFTGLWDSWSTYRTCTVCSDLRNEVDTGTSHYDEYINFGELGEHLLESRDREKLKKYIDNKILRDSIVPDWMLNRLAELNNNSI